MRKNLDENIKRQLEKKMTHFIKYFPVRIRNVGEDAILNQRDSCGTSRTEREKLQSKWHR